MIVAGVLLSGLMAQAVAAPRQSPGDCVTGVGLSLPALAVCHGDEEARLAEAAPEGSAERTRHLLLAADHYRRAADRGDAALKVRALEAFARLYDAQHLNDAEQVEFVLQDLAATAPTEPRFLYELAKVQEDRGSLDAAEDTLLSARRRWPTDEEPFTRLAQYYARRATSVRSAIEPPPPAEPPPDTPVTQPDGGVK